MDLGDALTARLSGAAAVTDLVDNRIHWVLRPQGEELPALVLRQVSSLALAETVDDEGGMWLTRVQCDCYAKTSSEANRLAKAVGDELVEFAVVTAGAEEMLFWNGDREGPVDLGEDTSQGFEHRAMLEVVLRHSEAT